MNLLKFPSIGRDLPRKTREKEKKGKKDRKERKNQKAGAWGRFRRVAFTFLEAWTLANELTQALKEMPDVRKSEKEK